MTPDFKFDQTGLPCPCGYHETAYATNTDGSGKCFSSHCGQKFFPGKDFWQHFNECKPETYCSRSVPKGVGEKFGALQHVDNEGKVQFYSFPHDKIDRVKVIRLADKKSMWSGEHGDPIPVIGPQAYYDAGTVRNAYIVEGEKDFLAAYTMLNKGNKIEQHVYYIPSAGVSKKGRQDVYDQLKGYDRIIVASENDEAGKATREVFSALFGTKMRTANLTKHKDASDYLVAGDTEDFKRACTNYTAFTPDYIFNGIDKLSDLWVSKEAGFYVPTPFAGLNKLIKGIPLGHVTLIAGMEGLGKTSLLQAFEWEVIKAVADKEDYGISVTHFEEDGKTTLAGYCCYDQSINFRDPDVDYPLDLARPTLEKLNNFFLTDFYKARDEMSVKSFMEKIKYLHDVCGVRFFFLDPINQLRPDSDEETLEKFLTGLARDLERFCVDNHCAAIWTAHVNDDGQTRDSRMISKLASIRINLTRDEESGIVSMFVDKNRPFSRRGYAGDLAFDESTFTLVDNSNNEIEDTQETKQKPAKASRSKGF